MVNIIKNIQSLIPFIKTIDLFGVEPAILHIIKLCIKKYHSEIAKSPKLIFLIQSSLDRMQERLNMGHWKEVSLNDRRCITVLSFFKVLSYMESNNCSIDSTINSAFEIIDNGLLFGAPLSGVRGNLLHQCANYLSIWKTGLNSSENLTNNVASRKESKLSNVINIQTLASVSCASEADWEDMAEMSNHFLSEEKTKSNFKINLDRDSCPSIEKFYLKYFTTKTPIILTECISHWPAMKLWPDMNYIVSKAGHRTVPVELGSKYTDDDWTQKLMTVKDFIEEQINNNPSTIGYLAQHQLFNQISELSDDIKEPEYCCLHEEEASSEEETDINAWFGPEGTVSPLHYDPKHNLLAQVVGEKLIILFPPEDEPYLYCHPDNLLSNTAQVDPTEPDLQKYPQFTKATSYYCILKPGEMLYIPPRWWHYVKSLSVSFSVSFWWK